MVTLNAIQFLAVKSGYMTCQDAGCGFKGGNQSQTYDDDGAIFHAWLQAKKDKLIPIEDPIPTRGINYIAIEHKIVDKIIKDERLGWNEKNKVLDIVEEEY